MLYISMKTIESDGLYIYIYIYIYILRERERERERDWEKEFGTPCRLHDLVMMMMIYIYIYIYIHFVSQHFFFIFWYILVCAKYVSLSNQFNLSYTATWHQSAPCRLILFSLESRLLYDDNCGFTRSHQYRLKQMRKNQHSLNNQRQ